MSGDKHNPESSSGGAGVTMINVIEIPADQIEKFLVDWRTRAHIMSTLPGFRDFHLHQALLPDSRFQLINVAHWDSAEAVEAAMSNPTFQANRQAVELRGDLDVKPYAALYEVVISSDQT
jgi:heme oxygenase (mycobilin-producing)